MNIPDDAVDAAARHLAFYTDRDIDWTVEARALLDAAAPHILESAAHDLAGADKTSHWDDLYRRFEEQDGGDLSSDSTAYLNGIADAMRFLQDRATTNPHRSQGVIPEESVEAAAFNNIANLVTWSAWGGGTPDEAAAKILEAITPMLKAEAWNEGYAAADHDAPHSIKTGNPYRSQP